VKKSRISCLFVTCALVVISSGCTRLFYYPEREYIREVGDYLGKAESVLIEAENQPALIGWKMYATQQPAKAHIVFFHGNAQNVSMHAPLVSWLTRYGFDASLIDYRGYGRSEGNVEIEGMHEDVLRMIEWAKADAKKHNQEVIIFGQSLGASMLPWALAQKDTSEDVCAVVLESPFYSYHSIAFEKIRQAGILAYLLSPSVFFIRDDYSPKHFVPHIKNDLLFVASGQDNVISPKQTKSLLALSQQADLWEVPEASHVQAFSSKKWRKKLVHYLRETCDI
jgi:pimeloyl-ACP methyl ester carboxylesterase